MGHNANRYEYMHMYIFSRVYTKHIYTIMYVYTYIYILCISEYTSISRIVVEKPPSYNLSTNPPNGLVGREAPNGFELASLEKLAETKSTKLSHAQFGFDGWGLSGLGRVG